MWTPTTEPTAACKGPFQMKARTLSTRFTFQLCRGNDVTIVDIPHDLEATAVHICLASSLNCWSFQIWDFPKIRGTFLGVPIIRIIVFWGLCWGPLVLGNYHMKAAKGCGQRVQKHDAARHRAGK